MKQVCDGCAGGNNFVRARSVLSRRLHHSCDTLSSGEVLSNSGKNKGFVTSNLQPNFVSSTSSTQTQMICRLCQEACTFQSCACELMDSQSVCQQHLGTQRECFRLVSERARMSPTRFLDFLPSAEKPHLIDAGSTVTCLVHGQAAESQSVGCCFEQFCCGSVIEISDDLYQISIL